MNDENDLMIDHPGEPYDGIASKNKNETWVHLGVIERLYYDGPIEEVHAVLCPQGELRLEIRLDNYNCRETPALIGNEEDHNDWVSFTPTLEIVQKWISEAERLHAEFKRKEESRNF